MHVLIIENSDSQAKVWSDHISDLQATITVARDRDEAVTALRTLKFDVMVLNLALANGTALTIADYAAYRQPWARMIFVTSTPGYSDGHLLSDYANARGVMQSDVPPEDLAAVVDYYAKCA